MSSPPGGRVTYYMTGPEGDKHAGYWNIISVDEPTGFTFTDGFADADFTPIESMPVSTNEFSFQDKGGSTIATYVSTYATAEGSSRCSTWAWWRAPRRRSARLTTSSRREPVGSPHRAISPPRPPRALGGEQARRSRHFCCDHAS